MANNIFWWSYRSRMQQRAPGLQLTDARVRAAETD